MSQWHGGKGSKPRKVKDQKTFSDNWDTIFGKKIDMWEHNCKHNGLMSVGKGEPCNWCGAEELSLDKTGQVCDNGRPEVKEGIAEKMQYDKV